VTDIIKPTCFLKGNDVRQLHTLWAKFENLKGYKNFKNNNQHHL